MNRKTRNATLLIAPFLAMVLVNEIVRPTIKEKPNSLNGITAINPALPSKDKCTWRCHNDTAFCKQNHVKHAGRLFNIIDPVYFGIINLLKSTGNYAVANILFLVLLLPLLMYYLLVKIFNIQMEINSIKNKNGIPE